MSKSWQIECTGSDMSPCHPLKSSIACHFCGVCSLTCFRRKRSSRTLLSLLNGAALSAFSACRFNRRFSSTFSFLTAARLAFFIAVLESGRHSCVASSVVGAPLGTSTPCSEAMVGSCSVIATLATWSTTVQYVMCERNRILVVFGPRYSLALTTAPRIFGRPKKESAKWASPRPNDIIVLSNFPESFKETHNKKARKSVDLFDRAFSRHTKSLSRCALLRSTREGRTTRLTSAMIRHCIFGPCHVLDPRIAFFLSML